MRRSGVLVAAIFAAGVTAVPALAQVAVPAAPDCVCLRVVVDALGQDLAAKRQAYDGLRSEIGQIDGQLEAERTRMDVNSPEAIARFRQLLEHRDALFNRSSGPAFSELSAATDRYGMRQQEYNARCAGRPMDPGLLAGAARACPPPY